MVSAAILHGVRLSRTDATPLCKNISLIDIKSVTKNTHRCDGKQRPPVQGECLAVMNPTAPKARWTPLNIAAMSRAPSGPPRG
jgi:hypothetical protein